MAESTLTLAYNDLAGEVGLFLGYGRGAALGDPAWTSQQQASIDSCVRSGLRQFYWPAPVEGRTDSYDWSFLKPVATLTLPAATPTLSLPDDFGGVEGRITLQSFSGLQWWPIDFVGIGQVYQQYQQYPTTTGRPLLACVEPVKGTTPTQSQRFQLRIWPQADQGYQLQFAYYINPDYLTGGMPYAYGGAPHMETLLESCLAIAEQRLDDTAAVHSMKFKERLMASMSMDRRHKPQTLGYNGDRSDLRERRFGPNGRWYGDNSISVAGKVY